MKINNDFLRRVIFMNYEELSNLPVLNGITIIGDRTFEDYGLVPISSKELAELQLEIFGYIL
jgi:hypothetical protein